MVVIVMITIADFIIAGFIVNVKAIVLANNTAPAIRSVVNITVVVNSGKLKGEKMKPKHMLDDLRIKSSKDPPRIIKTIIISNQTIVSSDRTFCRCNNDCNDCGCNSDGYCANEPGGIEHCNWHCTCENVCDCENNCTCDMECSRE